eukprot:ANDGO_05860.mRNA.1 DNA replication licensing factor MCM3 homolog 1
MATSEILSENEIKRSFSDFLEHNFGGRLYSDDVRKLVEQLQARLVLNVNDLRDFNPDFARRVLSSPADYVPVLETALQENLALFEAGYFEANPHLEARIGFSGDFGAQHVTPRGLSATFLGQVVCVDGIVTKCSVVRPKVSRSVHYCPATKNFTTQVYRDATSLRGLPTSSIYPTRDESGNPLVTEFGLSTYRDTQSLSIQEMPEAAPAGQLPRSVDCLVEGDLVDRVKPGDRVRLFGIYRALSGGRVTGNVSGVFRTVLMISHISYLGKQAIAPHMTERDIERIRRLADPAQSGKSGPEVVQYLAKSVAPSIYGHEAIKRALLLVLVGGIEKNLANGTHLRGDVNILMVGDPSTAKSQLLRFVLTVAPLAISTTGRGSSGVGLTAAVVTDADTGDRQLQAGAMVLADRGVVCIDEFDKMSDSDRVAMHEVMEQQTVTIAKAGVHTSLNARCSVIAAANPVYGNYDVSRRPMENIGLPDSLLSRFDLLYVVLDALSAEQDRMIAEHVLRLHRYRAVGDTGDALMTSSSDRTHGVVDEALTTMGEGNERDADRDDALDQDDDGDDDGNASDSDMYQKYHPLLHRERGLLSLSFLKKYIYYAKTRMSPALTDEARDVIVTAYSDLRTEAHGDKNTLPITPRSLETLIRLSTAHAKLRLSLVVSKEDAMEAVKILKNALYQENLTAGLKKKREREQEIANAGSDIDSEVEEEGIAKPKQRSLVDSARKERPKRKTAVQKVVDDVNSDEEGSDDPFKFDDSADKGAAPKPAKKAKPASQPPKAAASPSVDSVSATVRSGQFRTTLANMLHMSASESVSLQEVIAKFHGVFSKDEILMMIEDLSRENKVFFHAESGQIHTV